MWYNNTMNTLEIIEEIRSNPTLAAELRALLLSEELLTLPERMLVMERSLAELVEISKHHEDILKHHEDALKRHEVLLAELVEISKHHEDALKRHEVLLAELVEISKHHEDLLKRHDGRLGNIRGDLYEEKSRKAAVAIFVRVSGGLRHIHVVDRADLADRLDDLIDEGRIDDSTREDILLADIIVTAKRRSDGAQLWVVAEVSIGLADSDVERAKRRAAALSNALGVECLAVVVGDVAPVNLDLADTELVIYHDSAA